MDVTESHVHQRVEVILTSVSTIEELSIHDFDVVHIGRS